MNTRCPLLRPEPSAIWLYAFADQLSGGLLLAMIVFGPWAFGTTQPWSLWIMNVCGYAAGAFWLAKLAIRWATGYAPPRWALSPCPTQLLQGLLGLLTVLLLAYCLVAAINARASYRPGALSFVDHEFISWLPHSFDAPRSWAAFWMYLGLAGAFWALQDWLVGYSASEQRPGKNSECMGLLSARMRLVLWVLAINGGLLALEGIVQRLEGSGRLLFLVQPRVNPQAAAQFGPFAYRANAAQYFNLLWPPCLGFWWVLQRSGAGKWQRYAVLACVTLMAASPIISTSRGGALITVGLLISVLLLYAGPSWSRSEAHDSKAPRWALAAFAGAVLGLGLGLGWATLQPRMAEFHAGLAAREEMFDRARPIAQDYPVFGTGPGTFESVFQFYRQTVDTYWPAQLHNDWLETRITFGFVGMGLVMAALGVVLVRWFFPGKLYGGRHFVPTLWLSLTGCLVHARFDFPFQVHSVLFLFLVFSAFLWHVSRHPSKTEISRWLTGRQD